MHDHRQNRAIGLALLALLIVMIIIGVAVTRSRAGMALLFVAGLSSLLLAWRHDRGQSRAAPAALCDWCQPCRAAPRISVRICWICARFEYQGFDDLRWRAAQVTSQAAIANLPFGSGFGTFTPVYEQFAPRTLLWMEISMSTTLTTTG